MIYWSDAAIEAAWNALNEGQYKLTSNDEDMRAALDAAVKAQGFPYPRGFYCEPEMIQAIAKARADALEEAAKIADGAYPSGIAAAIRALKEKGGEQ